MLYWSPDPVSGSFYRYEENSTRGFSLTHLSGTGCGVFGDVPILPMLGVPDQPPPVRSNVYRGDYTHADETAEPGYYAVKFSSGIRVQLTADVHSGIAEIVYPEGNSPHTLLIDLSRNLTHVYDARIHIADHEISGSVASGGFCNLDNRYRVYFVIATEEPLQSGGTFNAMRVTPGELEASGPRIGGYAAFASSVHALHIKVAVSYVSIDNARMNLTQEIPAWDFDGVRNAARATWNSALAHIDVSGGTEAERTTFYTALYHSLLHPTVFNDVNGQYPGFDGEVHAVTGRKQYANYSGWDIYRTQVPLIAMLMPDVAGDIAQSLVADAEQGGGLPLWPIANDESSCMIGDPSDEILAGIYAFGVRSFDVQNAFKYMVRGASEPHAHIHIYPERPGLSSYLERGYVPEGDGINGGASVTLEDQSADFAIAQMAETLGKESVAKQYLARAAEWRKLYDPETGYIRARFENGQFMPDFSPTQVAGYVEGNAAQYTWMVPWDLRGLIKTLGGPATTSARLDNYFSQYATWNGGPYFFIGNEPSFGDPWLYNWTGQPWRTQEVIRKTLNDLFQPVPDGEPGNDDLGATSAWIVLANLGIYPEIPAVAGFTLNSPVFPKATLLLGAHRVTISAPGAPGQLYVKSVSVDDKPVANWWIDWAALKSAHDVKFTLDSKPVLDPGQAPPSFMPAESPAVLASGAGK